ncbi:MAG: hypothetical protein JWM59_62 [Verrucomicrobiales bacterium]|nr:hypothetical protein [Verrucomicrobiales bacterium]
MKLLSAAAVSAVFLSLAPASHAVTAIGLSGNSLVSFDTDDPATILTTSMISGLNPGDTIVDIDYRPSDNGLYAVSSAGALYSVDPVTGSASLNTTGSLGIVQDIDFNPVANRLRVFSEGNANYRITPGTGLTTSDGTMAYALDDTNSLATPSLVGAAYTNSFSGAATTVLYSLDSQLNTLVVHEGAPQFSSLRTVAGLSIGGFLTLDIGTDVGFDILSSGGSNTAYLTNGNQFFQLDLTTGEAAILADIGGADPLRPAITSLALVPEPGSVLLSTLSIGLLALRRRRRN